MDCNVTEVFLREKYRMCNLEGCNKCELANDKQLWCGDFICRYPKEAIEIVQKWSDAHPIKTRQSEFLEHYPNAQIRDGFIPMCPCMIDTRWKCARAAGSGLSCLECQKEYWLSEVK